jgi:hypothetical protein
MLLTSGHHFLDRIISLIGEAMANKTSFTQLPLIETPVTYKNTPTDFKCFGNKPSALNVFAFFI